MTDSDSASAGEGSVLCQIANDLDLLAQLHDRELDVELLEALCGASPENWFALPPTGEEAEAGFALLRDACRLFRGPPDPTLLDELAADFAGLHLNHAHRAAPGESVWMTEDGLTNQEPMFAVRDWYRRYDLHVPDWRLRSDDHLVNQIVFLGKLLRLETQPSLLDAGRFLDQHLMNWIGLYTDRASKNCETPFYAGLVLITDAYVVALRQVLEDITGELRQVPEEKTDEQPVREQPVQVYMPGTQPSW